MHAVPVPERHSVTVPMVAESLDMNTTAREQQESNCSPPKKFSTYYSLATSLEDPHIGLDLRSW